MNLNNNGDPAAAELLAALAPLSLEQPAGIDRMAWVKNECAQLRRSLGWETRSLKNAQQLTVSDVLAAPMPGVIVVYQARDNGGFIEHAFAKTVSADGRKFLCDMSAGYVRLDRGGLDACCMRR